MFGGQIQEFVPTVWFCNTFTEITTLKGFLMSSHFDTEF